MKDGKNFLRIIVTVVTSVLISILVVFAMADAQSKLTPTALEVQGIAVVDQGTTLSRTSGTINGLLIGFGNVGIGSKFLNPSTPPSAKLDVEGDINVTGNFLKNGAPFSAGAVEKIAGSSCPSGEFTVAKRVQARTCTGVQTGLANPPNCQPTSCTIPGGWLSGSTPTPTCDFRDVHWNAGTQLIDACDVTPRTCTASVSEVACIGD